MCCIKSFALVIFPFRMPTASVLYNYNMLTYTSTYAQIRFQMTKSWASASNAFTLNLGYLLALCHQKINKCLLLSDDADITWQTPSCTQWCRYRNELHILIHPKTNFSTHYRSGTQRLSYDGYEKQDHPMKSSVTHSVTKSHTHTHTQHKTTGRREVGGGVNSKSVQLHQLIPVGTQEAFCHWITLMSVGLCWSTTWAAFPATPSAGRAQNQTACNYCIIALFSFVLLLKTVSKPLEASLILSSMTKSKTF